MTTTTGPATNYHATVDDLRRDLMASHLDMVKCSEEYFVATKDPEKAKQLKPREVISDAWMASTAAYNTSYALAAVLKIAQRELGEEAARTLAFEVDEILTNGDFDDLNADVMPEVTV